MRDPIFQRITGTRSEWENLIKDFHSCQGEIFLKDLIVSQKKNAWIVDADSMFQRSSNPDRVVRNDLCFVEWICPDCGYRYAFQVKVANRDELINKLDNGYNNCKKCASLRNRDINCI